MNIAIANEFFPPYITGGTEIFLEELARYLKSAGFNVIVITTEQGQKENNEFKVYKIVSSPFHFSYRYQFHGITIPWMFFNFRLRKSIEKIYEKEKIDAIHANNLFHLSFAPIQTKLPFVLDIHDYWPVCFSKDLYYCNTSHCLVAGIFKCPYCLSKKMSVPILSPLLLPGLAIEQFLKRKYLGNADKIICHSNFAEDRIKGYHTNVIPIPFLGKLCSNGHNSKRNKELRLLFAGRLEQKKGAHLLVEIAKGLMEKGIVFRIDIIGNGPLKQHLNRPDLFMHAHGFVDSVTKFELLNHADCLLAPSLWPEPFGAVALEAMAYKVPIITVKGSGLAQLVKENGAGMVCDVDSLVENIVRLAINRLLRKSIMENDVKNIVKYDKNRIFRSYKEMFEGMI